MILAFTENQALCGHGAERRIVGALVDSYNPTTKTTAAIDRHGCRHCFPNSRNEIINHGQTREKSVLVKVERIRALRDSGYRVNEKL